MKIYFVTLIILFLSIGSAKAEIYKYVDENGVVHFSNAPTEVKYKLIKKKSSVKSYYSKRVKDCEPIINKMCNKYSVDPALVKAIIKAESDFNPIAVSKKGASGLMQLTPGTASSLKVNNIFNVDENIEGGVKYIKYLLDLFNNNLLFAVAAYNAGENAVKKYKDIPPYKETRNYVQKVMTYYKAFSK
jgi:soluble lytic murein transglycosylase-like protein